MFKNVIVGVDGEQGGRDAIALARILRDAAGELTFAYVYAGESYVWRGSNPAYLAVEERSSHELLEHAVEESGLEAKLRSTAAPTVGRGLHELAEEVGADLIVVGSSHRGLLGRVMIGNDTKAALNGAPCAVAIAPAGYSREHVHLREVGVGYDGSPESEHALGVARKLAVAFGTRLSAFEAVYVPARAYAGPGFAAMPDIEEMLEAARERITGLGNVEPHAAYGRPAEELALYSASLDLLVVGSRSYGPVGRLMHGSTAQELAHKARCPLLVLTRSARQADAARSPELKSRQAPASVGS